MIVSTASVASAAPGICSEDLRVGDTVSVYHYGHYDSLKFVDAYNAGDAALHQDAHWHLFHNRTHLDEALHQKCATVYINHPGTL